jgi:hypothetical protein
LEAKGGAVVLEHSELVADELVGRLGSAQTTLRYKHDLRRKDG